MSWYYLKDGAQQGPISKEELTGLYEAKTVQGEDLVWTDGMSDWKRAGEVLQSAVNTPVTPQQVLAPTQSAPTQGTGNEIYAPPSSHEVTSRGSGSLEGVEIKRASFPLLLSLGIISFVLYIGGMIAIEESSNDGLEVAGGVSVGLAVILYIVLMVLSLKYLYRCWKIINAATDGYTRATPGQAVGFMFIPFFNLYWVYVAYYGWSQEYNKLAAQHGWNNQVPEGIFLTTCILQSCCLIPFLNILAYLGLIVIGPMMIYQMCWTINHHANA